MRNYVYIAYFEVCIITDEIVWRETIREDRVGAVSYTHLDVYKRQVHYDLIHLNIWKK